MGVKPGSPERAVLHGSETLLGVRPGSPKRAVTSGFGVTDGDAGSAGKNGKAGCVHTHAEATAE